MNELGSYGLPAFCHTAISRLNLIKTRCPNCSKKDNKEINLRNLKEMERIKRLQTLREEWDSNKNSPKIFDEMTRGSSRMVWWKCREKHSWQARFSNRINGSNCPYCTHMIPIKGENDLLTLFPAIAEEWHPDKNGPLMASELLPRSHKSQ